MYFKVLIVILCFYYANCQFYNRYVLYLMEKYRELEPTLNKSSITTKWIEQRLDHYNDSDTRKWNMKYYEKTANWREGGPIYIIIGGEAPAEIITQFIQNGTTAELAQETNGAIYLTEHRYYGDSKPFPVLDTQNLKYLSSKQALADIAHLVKVLKQSQQYRSSKVVIAGGSYAGNLVTWMKVLYPDLVDAAIASSAPVLAKADFFEYLEKVSDDFKIYGTPGCFDKITGMFNRYKQLLSTDHGIEKLKKEENICSELDMKNWQNEMFFYEIKIASFDTSAQYGTVESIESVCKEINFYSKLSNENIAKEDFNCVRYDFDVYIARLKGGDLSWFYQICTEFGYFTISPKTPPFDSIIELRYYFILCSALFGPDFDGKRVADGVEATNALYGGQTPNVTKVVFVNGELDPWSKLGVVEDLSPDAPAIVTPRASHCSDMWTAETPELKETAKFIKMLIKKWIGFA